jgi:outer membrane protein OmpA-like peptidoglycan-associated protein
MLPRPYLFVVLSCFALLLVYPARSQSRHYDTLVLHFGFNKDIPPQEDASRIGRLFHSKDRIIDTLVIAGYTDTVGTNAYNQRLSLRRAQAMANYIEQLPGVVSLPEIKVRALGEVAPIAGSDSLNRRVEIILGYRTMAPAVAAAPPESAPSGSAPGPSGSAPSATAPQPDTIITLTNINFIEDSPNLTEASIMLIPEYVRMLQRYKADSLDIDGYCNSLTPITNTDDPLFRLSVKRAKFIFDYLVDEGFDRTKLSYKGMGNATPKNEHPVTAEEARANMRVEIRVFSKRP